MAPFWIGIISARKNKSNTYGREHQVWSPTAAVHNKISTLGKGKTKVTWYHNYSQPREESLGLTKVRDKASFDVTGARVITSVNEEEMLPPGMYPSHVSLAFQTSPGMKREV